MENWRQKKRKYHRWLRSFKGTAERVLFYVDYLRKIYLWRTNCSWLIVRVWLTCLILEILFIVSYSWFSWFVFCTHSYQQAKIMSQIPHGLYVQFRYAPFPITTSKAMEDGLYEIRQATQREWSRWSSTGRIWIQLITPKFWDDCVTNNLEIWQVLRKCCEACLKGFCYNFYSFIADYETANRDLCGGKPTDCQPWSQWSDWFRRTSLLNWKVLLL